MNEIAAMIKNATVMASQSTDERESLSSIWDT